MRKFFLPLILFCAIVRAQDTTKLLHHEIGFNAVGLIKQAISNTPTVALQQLPYTVFYNLNYKGVIGLRCGLGYFSDYSEIEIPGQQPPRITDTKQLDLRLGITYNIIRSKKFQINFFTDYVRENYTTQTLNTVTVQVFPNPKQVITTEISEKTRGEGAQLGAGLSWHLHKHVSVYTEIPFTYVSRVNVTGVYIDDTNEINESNTTARTYTGRFFPPTTFYLVMRF